MTSFLWFQNSIDQAVSLNKCFMIYRTTAKSYVVCRNTAKVVKLKVDVLQPRGGGGRLAYVMIRRCATIILGTFLGCSRISGYHFLAIPRFLGIIFFG